MNDKINRILVYGMVGTNRGGIETFLLKMSSYMSSNTIFDYVVEGNECIHKEEIASKGGNIYYIPSRNKHPIKNIFANRKLLKEQRNSHVSVYFNLSSLSWLFPIKIASRLKYKIFVHSHNADFIEANGSYIYRVINKHNKKVLSKMDITRLTCSKPATTFMFGENSDAIMIYNAIDPQLFKFNESSREKIREEYNLKDTFVIGFVGRIQYQKNPLFLADILENVVKEKTNVKMIIIGEGDMKESLLSKINEKGLSSYVLLTGIVGNVNEFLQAFDVFVLPSHHEGLPYVSVEAQTAGLKCLLSDKITKELVFTNNVSFLSIDNGAGEWKDAILSIDNNIANRHQGYEIVKDSHFDIHSEARRLERLLTNEKN